MDPICFADKPIRHHFRTSHSELSATSWLKIWAGRWPGLMGRACRGAYGLTIHRTGATGVGLIEERRAQSGNGDIPSALDRMIGLAALSKCLAQTNKSSDAGRTTKKLTSRSCASKSQGRPYQLLNLPAPGATNRQVKSNSEPRERHG